MPCCCSCPSTPAVRPVRSRRARAASSSMCGASTSPTMPTCCRPICASCAASSTARTCRSTSRARCCRTIRRWRRSATAVTGRVHRRAGEHSPTRTPRRYGKIWEAFGAVLKEGLYEDHERRDQLLALARFATTAGDGLRSLKQYVADLKPNQTEIYYLVGESVERLKSNPEARGGARARHRGAAADRSDRCLLDHDAAGLRGQAAEVAEPGRRRFRPGAAARRRKPRPSRTAAEPTRTRCHRRRSRTRSASRSRTCAPRSG